MRIACSDLEEIDLSENAIKVETIEEVECFEALLEGLKHCQTLSKINLSGNHIGSRAMEAFARIFLRQFKENVNLIESGGDEEEEEIHATVGVSGDKRKMSISSRRRRPGPVGLATVDVINLSSCSITDSGALWLSYVLPKLAWALAQRDGKADGGIICWPNHLLSPIGTKLLRQAEAVVYDSFSACEVNDSHEHALEELSSLRKKVQRAILENKGVSVDLWQASLRLLSLTRQIMLSTTLTPWTNSPDRSSSSNNNHSSPLSERSTILSDISEASSHSPTGIRHQKPAPLGTSSTYASRLLLNTDALLSITEAEEEPVKPTVLRSRKRRDSFSVGSDIVTTSPSSSVLGQNIAPRVSFDNPLVLSAGLHEGLPGFSPSYMQQHLEAPQHLRETVRIGPLPEAAWELILPMVADERGVMSEQQRKQIMRYARNRRTLSGEKESRGKAASVQVWRCLEAMGGLEYDGL